MFRFRFRKNMRNYICIMIRYIAAVNFLFSRRLCTIFKTTAPLYYRRFFYLNLTVKAQCTEYLQNHHTFIESAGLIAGKSIGENRRDNNSFLLNRNSKMILSDRITQVVVTKMWIINTSTQIIVRRFCAVSFNIEV